MAFLTFAKHLRNAGRTREDAETRCLALNSGVLTNRVTPFCRPPLDGPAIVATVGGAYGGGASDGYTGLGCDDAWADQFCDADCRATCGVARAAAARDAVLRALASSDFEPHSTDVGNAARFAVDHRSPARHCWPWKKWLL